MAKKIPKACCAGVSAERIAYSLLIVLLGAIWLAEELGFIYTGAPFGPAIVIIIGLAMILPLLREK